MQVLAVSMRRARVRSLAKLAAGSRALQRDVLESVFYHFSGISRVPVDSAVDAVLNKVLRDKSEGLSHLLLDSDLGHTGRKAPRPAETVESRYLGRGPSS